MKGKALTIILVNECFLKLMKSRRTPGFREKVRGRIMVDEGGGQGRRERVFPMSTGY